MRAYSISIMVISVFSLALTLILFLGEYKDYSLPSAALKGQEYKKYLHFDYFRDQELKAETVSKKDSEEPSFLMSLSYDEWIQRWKEFRLFTVESAVQEARSDMFNLLFSFIVFSFLFVGHYILFKRFEQDRTHGVFY